MRGIIISLCLLLLSACGGSGSDSKGSSPTSIKSIVSSASSQPLSSRASQSTSSIAPAPSSFLIDEDTVLQIRPDGLGDNLSLYLVDLFTVVSGQRVPMETISRNGGKVVVSSDLKSITYTPKKNFFGDDDFYYWMQGIGINNMIKASITVSPVVDGQPDFSFDENRFFVAGDVVLLGHLFDVDTLGSFAPDASTKIYINSVSVEYDLTENGLSIVVPATDRAGLQSIVYEQEVQGRLVRVEKDLLVRIVNGDVTYYQGNKDAPGQSVVLVWTEGISSVLPASWMNKELGLFLKIPLHRVYSQYFNISAITPVAKRVLYPGTSTADFSFYSEFVRKYSQSDSQMVILVSELGGGNAGNLVTMGPDGGMKILLHELGHLHAGLADEYVSAVLDSAYTEGVNPNVTHFFYRDIAQVPWKHWLVDKNRIPGIHVNPVSDIETGIFEGAHYTTTGLYRPTHNSVMNKGDHLGEVNSEAWAIANYTQLGLLRFAISEKENNLRVIDLKRTWNKNITRVDWYIDGVHQDDLVNQARIEIDENKISASSYNVRAELIDLTGYIKKPLVPSALGTEPVRNTNFSRVWSVNKTAITAASQKTKKDSFASTSDVGGEWIGHAMKVVDGQHQMDSTYNVSKPELLMPVTAVSSLRVDIVVAGEVVSSQGINLQQFDLDPIAIPLRQSPTQGYRIVYPKIEGNYSLRIYSVPEANLLTEFAFQVKK